ncbi:virulence factor TspB C-terminal domain-related protein [Pelomonas sp. APW6]|uniref:Virulence factor TspB C-terminal domain-related protein n=1 Tax=Roseateles subflavus TaxID=3053353 RepID=A0ABT7LT40_9BURK|nr:virulence factor TspB C-terminal domain-related protein [Pelomonas sp. APW6]MDL5034661.1 virulence factor TspB C-terminal domain-related protein [Pelomonas sp. APW6]
MILLFWCVLLSPSAWSYGQVGPTAIQVYKCADKYTGSSPADACNAWIAAQPAKTMEGSVNVTWTRKLSGCTASLCTVVVVGMFWDSYFQRDWQYSYSEPQLTVTSSGGQGCPPNSRQVPGSSSKCECNNGTSPQAGQCVPYACPAAGNYTATTQPDQAVTNAGDGICQGGCGYTPSSWKAGQDGTIWAAWPFKSTGKACAGLAGTDGVKTGEENTGKPAPVPCGQNQCPGMAGINGVMTQMCVACKGTSAAPTTEAASAPAGAASGSTTVGDQTKTTQTECDGTTCTTTTVTRDSGGSVTGSTSKQEPQENFCQANPNSPMCKKSSFGGSCAATACDGDAVQCALTQEVIKRNCLLFDDAGVTKPLQAAGDAAVGAGLKPSDHPGAEGNVTKVDASAAGRISQEDALPGSCPGDQAFSVASYNLVIPFSRVCEPAAILGKAMVALSMLVAALIIFKG